MSSVHQEEFADNAAAQAREKFLAQAVAHPPKVRDADLRRHGDDHASGTSGRMALSCRTSAIPTSTAC